MTARGVALVREGQYSLALRTDGATLRGTRLERRLEVECGRIEPGALPLVLADLVLLAGGQYPPGLCVGVLE